MKTWQTKSGTAITRILFGRSNVYLISNGASNLLIDTGLKGDGQRLLKRLEAIGKPDAVILTHTHFDHAGNAGLVLEHYAPKFIVHETEKTFLETGDSPIPRGTVGWTKFLYRLGPYRVPHWFHVRGVKAEITFTDRYDLLSFGFNAYILHTPGHSAGSSCVIIDNEIAVAGDAIGGMPGAVFSPWGDDGTEMTCSWRKLLDTGCHTYHPAHGVPVSRKKLETEFLKRQSR